jgi:hypothetical protein
VGIARTINQEVASISPEVASISPEVASISPELASISQSTRMRLELKPATIMMRFTLPVKMADNIKSENSTVVATAVDAGDTEEMSTEVVIEATTEEVLVATTMRAMAIPLISNPSPLESTNQRRKMTAKSLKMMRSS